VDYVWVVALFGEGPFAKEHRQFSAYWNEAYVLLVGDVPKISSALTSAGFAKNRRRSHRDAFISKLNELISTINFLNSIADDSVLAITGIEN
jgi:hypothetical protein